MNGRLVTATSTAAEAATSAGSFFAEIDVIVDCGVHGI
jgi:hypothetical protein